MARVLKTPEAFAAAFLHVKQEGHAVSDGAELLTTRRQCRQECDKLSSTKEVEPKSKDKMESDKSVSALTGQIQKQLDLNHASETDIVNGLTSVRGVGLLSVNRIVTQRFIDGHFLNERDFDRRVRHMSLRRLRRLSNDAGLVIKLGLTDGSKLSEEVTKTKGLGNEGLDNGGKLDCKLDLKKSGPTEGNDNRTSGNYARTVRRRTRSECGKVRDNIYRVSNVSEQSMSITMVSWNTARLSPHTGTFWGKVGHILTFVEDSKADIVALQEVHKEGIGPLCRALTQATGDPWIRKHDTFGTTSDASLALLVRTSNVVLRQVDDQWDRTPIKDTLTSVNTEKRFKSVRKGIRTLTRVPQVYSMRAIRNGQTSRTVTFAHVHVSCSETKLETEVLGESLRRYSKSEESKDSENSDGVTMIIGDFNASATEKLSDVLRTAGFVELFSPRGITADGAFTTVISSTTAAGHWLDNVWVRRNLRWRVRDAWCFDLASRRRSLTQTRRAYAAFRRAAHSDHLPLMVTLDMSTEMQA